MTTHHKAFHRAALAGTMPVLRKGWQLRLEQTANGDHITQLARELPEKG
jgi:hypothetical protein